MKMKSWTFFLVITGAIIIGDPYAYARHHHGKAPPPPEEKKDLSLNPQQSPDDVSQFAKNAELAARQRQVNSTKNNKKSDAPAALFPGHYTKRSQRVNGTEGWVNSKRQRGKYDLGINMPVPQTGDPTQNKTRGVFRRAMPVYEPNY
ncbi:hypothetical protein [Commensalibacter oyaizuii]|uniref:Uncharacterized protein n=1 Tax=Commensalibacter oyaizuii TaxID=3043873 RepID=A0ABT6Q354_9PROT|nr:hypothetical protein [Commensalibacter sp. TBRC 16381]MDI2091450.1 hypothetical protein [Commensalibacter sp. TBRC 16381]